MDGRVDGWIIVLKKFQNAKFKFLKIIVRPSMILTPDD